MGEKPTEIERHIEQERRDLASNLLVIERKMRSSVKETLDWRTWFRKAPFTYLAVAFGGGLLLSSVFRGNRRRRTN
jgi:hypothetical protein